MKVYPVLKKYMVPFLREHGFELTSKGGGSWTFTAVSKPKQAIHFTVGTISQGICPEVSDGNGWSIPLLLLSFDPNDMIDAADHFWHYDNEYELIGCLEAQAVLLEQKGFAWLCGEFEHNVRAIIAENAVKMASATQAERKAFVEKWTKWNEEWRKRRFKPQNWLSGPNEIKN